MTRCAMLPFGLALSLMGCGDRGVGFPGSGAPKGDRAEFALSTAPAPPLTPPGGPAGMMGMMGPARAPAQDKPPVNEATANRKIIYNAAVDLVTESLNQFEAALLRLVSTQKGYVADSDRSGSAGSSRHGLWKVRVPADSYDAFLKGAVALGELVSVKADSQDVSEEFYDLEAREKAKKIEEERLLKHLSDSTGKLEEILAVERELSRVRGEIEQMQGRLRVLANLTALATVTVTVREVQDYIPPQTPTLATRVSRTFTESLASLRQFGESALLFGVALAPWLPLLFIGLGLAYWLARRLGAAVRTHLGPSGVEIRQ